MLQLCEMKEHALLKAYNEGYLPYYCVDVIKHIYTKRHRVKFHLDGQTSPLHLISNESIDIERYCNDNEILGGIGAFEDAPKKKIIPEQLTYDPIATELMQTARELLRGDMASKDKGTSRDARTLYEACYIHKNVWQMSKTGDLTHSAIHKRIKNATDKLKKKL